MHESFIPQGLSTCTSLLSNNYDVIVMLLKCYIIESKNVNVDDVNSIIWKDGRTKIIL